MKRTQVKKKNIYKDIYLIMASYYYDRKAIELSS